MATTNSIVSAFRWSEKYFYAPNFSNSRGEEEEDGENRQMQSVLLFQKNQQILINLNVDLLCRQ